METNQSENILPEENPQPVQENAPEEAGYTPRPRWQVWAARVGLVLFLLVVLLYYLNIMRGGL